MDDFECLQCGCKLENSSALCDECFDSEVEAAEQDDIQNVDFDEDDCL